MARNQLVIVNLSGRGDKDVQQVAQFLAARRREEPMTAEDLRERGGSLPKITSNGSP
jgi:hypothetical protein